MKLRADGRATIFNTAGTTNVVVESSAGVYNAAGTTDVMDMVGHNSTPPTESG